MEREPGQRRMPLTKERIIRAALNTVDREGLPALNMRRLGAELHVEAMAVYKHFPNKDAVLDGVVASILDDLSPDPSSPDWRSSFRQTFMAVWELLHAHINALPLIASRPLASPHLKARLESVRDLMLLSCTEEDALHLLHAGMGLTIGYLWLEAGGFVGELPDSEPFLRTQATESRNGVGRRTLTAAWSLEEDFAAGLELLVSDPGSGAG